MSLQAWILLWKVVLIAGLGLFSVMSAWIIVAGFKDVQALYSHLARQQRGRRKPRL